VIARTNTIDPRSGAHAFRAFAERHGRPLRVLHIGNVANNAYQIANLLNSLGADCDVVCRDYYHVMSCPEWEDADFSAPVADESRPDWTTIDLGGFERPKWFAQGREAFCLDYLLARRKASPSTDKFWRFLSISNKTSALSGLGLPQRIERHARILLDIGMRRLRMLLEPPAILLTRLDNRLSARGIDATRGRGYWICLGISTSLLSASAIIRVLMLPYYFVRMIYRISHPPRLQSAVTELASFFQDRFPHRADRFSLSDIQLQSLNHKLPAWEKLFGCYDIVHAYATDGILPLLAGKPYVAFEHGTIRDIPFEDSPQGRCCALTYRRANYVLITNADNRKAAVELDIPKFAFVPHMVNESYRPDEAQKSELHDALHRDLDSPYIVFHPARHHWSDTRRLEGDKGNDIFLSGFARFAKECEPRAKVILVRWGTRVEQTLSLIEKLGIAANVHWISPQPHRAMVRLICGSDLVADQFVLGAFGNIMPMALFCGRPAMLFLDGKLHDWCFEEMPPVVNAASPLEVFNGLNELHASASFAHDLVNRGSRWYSAYHSNERIGKILETAYAGARPELFGGTSVSGKSVARPTCAAE
jgi:glycosyltransferase involved in cell wall biosynthesis